jgi:septal ring factor EnvC (AmiA/AmiB activator)
MSRAGLTNAIEDFIILGLFVSAGFVALEVLDKHMGKEINMAATNHDDNKKVEYTSPPWAQRWFLQRSRDNWKKKYTQLKADAKRLQNRVNDVTKSRKQWCDETKQLNLRVQELEAENAALLEQLAAFKKAGLHAGTGPA